ncbi:hypothetical protein Back11_32130 [Paenibacillus baekrokdamisoli]|uniref:Copper amine oxidase-like N-terminal domain-containing protein n=1 Tax=Paenibacillus baekrokdamisoli TaxID=1712516 RepID=A0A3G9JD38_9BACL|nr:hypothetical protein [Paenibacillus baekrokdamisoli]MBB3071622.1 hypothetical protein [Paenibacillus baekrokdamisoli]BBH21868.1 hypothetical protein Back11_32130 [Paenibacillus baekrokdamisoli]
MFKKLVILASFLVVLPLSTVTSFAAEPLLVTVNENDYPASLFIIKDNRLYGSIETVSSMMGAMFGWVFKDKQSVSFVSHFSKEGNSDEFYTWFKNSKKVEISSTQSKEEQIQNLTMNNSTIISKDGEILLPLRDSIVALGKTISWDRKTNEITITGKIIY